MGRKRKTTMGKQKIEIKRIESEDARQVCFSKRKSGIFSKANELATLCGAEAAILVESPAGCPFSFGSPSVGPVVDRFLNGCLGVTDTGAHDALRLCKVQQLNNIGMEFGSKLDEAKKKKAMLENRIKELAEKNQDVRRAENIEDLNAKELTNLWRSLFGLRQKIYAKMCKELAANLNHDMTGTRAATMLNLAEPGSSLAGSSAPSLSEFGATDRGLGGPKVDGPAPVVLDLLGPPVNSGAEEPK